MAVGPHRIGAAERGSARALLVAFVMLSSALAVPSLAHAGSPYESTPPAHPSSEFRDSGSAPPVTPPRPLTTRAVPPAFSSASVGGVARTIFPGFNTSIPGSFTSSVATWLVGTPAYVPSTNTLWFPQRAIPVTGDPIPSVAPAAVFNLSSGQFESLDTNLSNASALVYDPGNGDLYAAEPASDSVVALNPQTGSIIGKAIPVGLTPIALTFDPNTHQLFVANSGSSNLTVIDTLTNSVTVGSVAVHADPIALVDDSRDGLVFVANAGSKFITAVNTTHPATLSVNISMYDGPPTGLAFSPLSDMVLATVASSQYATIIDAAEESPVDALLPVGTGMVPALGSANGTEFVLGNQSGSNLVVLNSTTGTTIESGIEVGAEVGELVLDTATGTVYSWGSALRILDTLNLSTGVATQLTQRSLPELVGINFATGSPTVIGAAKNESTIFAFNPSDLELMHQAIQAASPPLSVANDPVAGRFFVGTATGVTLFNSSTDETLGTISGLSGNCSDLVLDRPGNLLWLSNSLDGVVAVNLSNLHVVISTGLTPPTDALYGIAVDTTDSEVFVLVSTGSMTVLNSATGDVIASGINVGTNVTSVSFDSADDQVYAAGDTVNFIDGATLAVDGGVAPFGGPHRVLAEAYDPTRYAVLVTSVGILSSKQGTVTVIDGASVAASEGTTIEIPVGEEPAAVAVVPPQGAGGVGLATIWVANELSGTISVIATPPEVSHFAATPATVDLGQPVSIDVVFGGGAGAVTITYHGLPAGCVSTDAPELNCTPTAAGEFHLMVTLSDSLGEATEANATLEVMKTLALEVSLAPATLPQVDVGVSVVASASALNGLPPYNFSWSFGDGTVLPGANTSHAYSTPGDYSITAQVRDATGATADTSDTIIVVPRPSVSVVLIPGNVTDVDFPVELASKITGGTGTAGVTWSFGDNTDAIGANATHAWTRPGTYTVTVQCIDALGVVSNGTVNVTVHPSLAATFSGGNVSSGSPLVVGSPVSFSSAPTGGTPPYSVSWAFGDGSMATGASVNHSYGAAGTYRVAVTLIDAVGASVHSNLTVEISGISTPGGAITSPGGGFATGLFLGLVLGGIVAAVILFAAGPRKRDGMPSAPPTPYVPP